MRFGRSDKIQFISTVEGLESIFGADSTPSEDVQVKSGIFAQGVQDFAKQRARSLGQFDQGQQEQQPSQEEDAIHQRNAAYEN